MAPSSSSSTTTSEPRVPLRLGLGTGASPGAVAGAWWPQSRDLQTEAADLVDHFPAAAGHISRLLFSRPDWDDATTGDGRGVRRIRAERGAVKVGSFPRDDTQLMILSLASGDRLRLHVIPSETDAADGEQQLRSASGRKDG
jgi:hypothetical protein